MNRPTAIRHRIIAISTAMAFLLYLDRICIAEIVKLAAFRRDTQLSPAQIGRVLGSFFLAYALCQVPAGWFSTRVGARRMLTGCILGWSVFTAVTGAVASFPGLIAARLGCAVTQAGAYPASTALFRRWIPLAQRGRATSVLLVGGHLGGTFAPFLTAVAVFHLGHWRPVLWIYGAAGLVIAAFYWFGVRDEPTAHRGCNPAEIALIGRSHEVPRPARLSDLRALAGNGGLWLCGLSSFFVSFGSSYLITWLPTYLKEQRHLEDVAGGRTVTLILACGFFGQLAGGWVSDWTGHRFGFRRGRVIAFALPGLLAGPGYLGCLAGGPLWIPLACCSLVAFAGDMGNPAMWAIAQDIGGHATAAVFGWVNMWNNFGSAAVALLVPLLLSAGGTPAAGQRLVFLVCAGALFLSAILALGLGRVKPLP